MAADCVCDSAISDLCVRAKPPFAVTIRIPRIPSTDTEYCYYYGYGSRFPNDPRNRARPGSERDLISAALPV